LDKVDLMVQKISKIRSQRGAFATALFAVCASGAIDRLRHEGEDDPS
jgi:hypothetical protein